MSARAARALPTVAAVACCAWLAADDGGFYQRSWSAVAATLAVLVLVLAVTCPPWRPAIAPRPRVALLSLAGLTAWSLVTALWADAPGHAIHGAVVVAVYLAVFMLPLLWPVAAADAERAVLVVALGVAALGAVGAARAVDGSSPLVYGRLAWPTGYPNTTAAVLALGAWLALVVAARGTASPIVRAVALAVAVWSGGLLVLARSEGATATAVLAAALFIGLARRRLDALLTLLVCLLVLAPAVPALARVVNQYPEDQPAAVRHGLVLLGAATLAAVPVGLAAGLVRRLLVRRRAARGEPRARVRAAVVVAAVAVVAAAGVVAWSQAPVASSWRALTGGPATTTPASRFYGNGAAGNRLDFWRVGLLAFARHPIGGVGVDNYQAVYRREGRSDEQPRAPHSLAVTALAETGLVGAALLAVFVVALALTLVPAARTVGPAGTAAHATAVALAGWLGHAQLDWLWEMPASGAFALAVAGLGAGVVAGGAPARSRAVGVRTVAAAAAAAFALLAASLWLSDRYADRAARTWRADPAAAARDLRRAERLDPLDSAAPLLEGAIAERRGDWATMRDAFARAAARDRADWYAAYGLALAESRLGDRAAALAAARRAAALRPRSAAATRLAESLAER